jgi:hypothetical protein
MYFDRIFVVAPQFKIVLVSTFREIPYRDGILLKLIPKFKSDAMVGCIFR